MSRIKRDSKYKEMTSINPQRTPEDRDKNLSQTGLHPYTNHLKPENVGEICRKRDF